MMHTTGGVCLLSQAEILSPLYMGRAGSWVGRIPNLHSDTKEKGNNQ